MVRKALKAKLDLPGPKESKVKQAKKVPLDPSA